jgi:hypothetical protein
VGAPAEHIAQYNEEPAAVAELFDGAGASWICDPISAMKYLRVSTEALNFMIMRLLGRGSG